MLFQFHSDRTIKNTKLMVLRLCEIIPRRLLILKRSQGLLCQKQVSWAWVRYDNFRLFHSPLVQSMAFEKRLNTLQITHNLVELMYNSLWHLFVKKSASGTHQGRDKMNIIFAGGSFKCVSLNENHFIVMQISIFVLKGPFDCKAGVVQIMARQLVPQPMMNAVQLDLGWCTKASFGLRVLSLPASVCVCVCQCVCPSTPSLSAP